MYILLTLYHVNNIMFHFICDFTF